MRILSLCPDPTLAETRRRLFALGGHEVFTCDNTEDVVPCAQRHACDLVIICHSYPDEVKHTLVDELRLYSRSRVLLLHQYEVDRSLNAHYHFAIEQGPADLVATAQRAGIRRRAAAC